MTRFGNRNTEACIPLLTINNQRTQIKEKKKWKRSSVVIRFWIISILLIALIYLVNFFEFKSLKSLYKVIQIDKFPNLANKYNSLNGYLINTPGCRIPEMDPYDSTIKKFIFQPKAIMCNINLPPLFESNSTSLFVITKSLPSYNVSHIADLNCCYQVFWRRRPRGNEGDNQIKYSKNCIALNFSVVNIKEEFVKVICKNSTNKTLYEDYFAFVPIKKEIERRTAINTKPNVLIVGIDGVSRVNFHRQLPNTFRYLTKNISAFELLGYNKVADNTFPNLIPVLKGATERELEKSCWPTSNSRFDDCSFLWNDFSKNNYLTAFAEDCAWLGLFNYVKKGFLQQPTDYYYPNFNREMENKIGHYPHGNCIQCGGGREIYKVTLDYIRKFAIRMELESIPYFGFFWGNTLTHDFLNELALADQNYYQLLKHLKVNGLLENTVFILMSDHGIRYGEIRQTYQGQLEARLPFVFIALPEWFKDEFPTAVGNLRKNTRVLTSPFDLHETLKDLLDLNKLKSVGKIVKASRGYSLFNEIMSNRTCKDAEIASHWCTCQKSKEIKTNDSQVVAAAHFAIDDINSQLKGYAQCATLVINSILNARVLYYDKKHITEKSAVKDYIIILKTMPGEAVFEVTVRLNGNREKGLADVNQSANFKITGTISRLNLYGKQSYCITDYHLKLYCYCKSLLKK